MLQVTMLRKTLQVPDDLPDDVKVQPLWSSDLSAAGHCELVTQAADILYMLQALIKACLHEDHTQRPTFTSVVATVSSMLAALAA